MKEIEILYELIDDDKKVIEILQQYKSSDLKKTLDVYFFDPLRTDLQPEKNGRLRNAFRLRSKDGIISMAYKQDHFQNNDEWLYSDEHEIEISNFGVAQKIFKHLGLQELIRIESEKQYFLTSKYEITVEKVKNLGAFIEIERRDEIPNNQVSIVKNEIRDFIKKLGIKVGRELNAGKPELMLKKYKIN